MTGTNDTMAAATPFAAAAMQVRSGASDAVAAARELVRQLAAAERLGLLDGDQGFWAGVVDMGRHGYNHRPIVAGAVPRLGIPGIRFSDGPRGIVMGRSTCFPVSMARGATWDIALEEEIGRAIGAEGRAQGANLFAGVCINLLRHPAWGRAQETYGEDPVLLGQMGAALTRGVRTHMMACVKHFALNSIENARFVVDVRADDASLHSVYLPHFKAVLDAGAESVMSAYNSVNGEWCGDSPTLLTRILREEWGFAGFVMSDFIFGHRDPVGSVAAGLDLEMPFAQQRARRLPVALADGTLDPSDVERACVRLVATQLRYTARLDAPEPTRDIVANDAHRRLARRAAAQSMVLLRNESVGAAPVLPLVAARLQRVAILGRLATRANLGDRGSSMVRPPAKTSPLAGLQHALPGVVVEHDVGDDLHRAATLAAECDVAVLVVGYDARDEGEGLVAPLDDGIEMLPPPLGGAVFGRITSMALSAAARLRLMPGGDRASLSLAAADEALIEAVAAVQPRTIVVVIGASAVLMERWRERVPAILLAWYPGMEGGHALADVLLGAAEPGGRLPFAMATDAAHLPHFDAAARSIDYDRWWGQRLLDRDGHLPAYSFGFGLGYSTFALRAIALGALDAAERRVEVEVAVANTGARAGATVVQLYAQAAGAAPRRELLGFARVALAAGTEQRITLVASLQPLAQRDPATRTWNLVPGIYQLIAAQHCGDPAGVVTELLL